MTNHSIPLAAAVGILALTTARSPAQPPGPVQPPGLMPRPTVSPYLNLTRRGSSTALNYYNLVRPQNQFYQSLQQLQQEVGANTQDLTALQQPATGLPPTGHAVGFLTHGTYFMTMGRGGVARPVQQQMLQTPAVAGRGSPGAGFGRGVSSFGGARPTGAARPIGN